MAINTISKYLVLDVYLHDKTPETIKAIAADNDNGGLGYNKVYFPVCSSASINAGDLWQATIVYRNR